MAKGSRLPKRHTGIQSSKPCMAPPRPFLQPFPVPAVGSHTNRAHHRAQLTRLSAGRSGPGVQVRGSRAWPGDKLKLISSEPAKTVVVYPAHAYACGCGRLRVYLLKRQLTVGQKARSVHVLSDTKKEGFSYGRPHMYVCRPSQQMPECEEGPAPSGSRKEEKEEKTSKKLTACVSTSSLLEYCA